ncbi:hypothetical protein [Cytobacillus purgationiresistens]|uniref:ABC-type molybdenum transport system ATPase subunit/photorepair protein PhrA n=1 Tax=Cytobacillus purgationiresistens TaxID=863449 RepID=A0ABU0ABU0_9BACI|nr:hypothetical protein [Cytobacillus purgationiresistens]MDQ0268515.1 ABC-type molybdenum transport system ATPase subunit/photorepair protein PhrA [Cytobacillus purgationiresistens]
MGYHWATTGKVTVLGHSFGKTDLNELRKTIGWVSSSLQERMWPNELAQNIVVSGKFAFCGYITAEDLERANSLMEQFSCNHLFNPISIMLTR